MKDLLTHIPPTLSRTADGFVITTSFEMDGQSYSVSAPIGDGRYHAQRVHDLVIGPALGRHATDGAPFAPVDVDPN